MASGGTERQHTTERGSAVVATAIVHFLQSWIPQVLRLRRVYSRAYFDAQAVTWDPTSAFTVRSHAGPDGTSIQTRAGITVARSVKDAELCEYLDHVLRDLFQLLVEQEISDIAVVIWERQPRRPIERHVLSLHNVFAAASSSSSSSSSSSTATADSRHLNDDDDNNDQNNNDNDNDEDGRGGAEGPDETQIQTAVNEALKRLWAAYKIKEATIDPLPSSLQLTWTLAICPPRPIDAPAGWDSGQASVLAAGKNIVPVRTIPLGFGGAAEPSIGLSIEVLDDDAAH